MSTLPVYNYDFEQDFQTIRQMEASGNRLRRVHQKINLIRNWAKLRCLDIIIASVDFDDFYNVACAFLLCHDISPDIKPKDSWREWRYAIRSIHKPKDRSISSKTHDSKSLTSFTSKDNISELFSTTSSITCSVDLDGLSLSGLSIEEVGKKKNDSSVHSIDRDDNKENIVNHFKPASKRSVKGLKEQSKKKSSVSLVKESKITGSKTEKRTTTTLIHSVPSSVLYTPEQPIELRQEIQKPADKRKLDQKPKDKPITPTAGAEKDAPKPLISQPIQSQTEDIIPSVVVGEDQVPKATSLDCHSDGGSSLVSVRSVETQTQEGPEEVTPLVSDPPSVLHQGGVIVCAGEEVSEGVTATCSKGGEETREISICSSNGGESSALVEKSIEIPPPTSMRTSVEQEEPQPIIIHPSENHSEALVVGVVQNSESALSIDINCDEDGEEKEEVEVEKEDVCEKSALLPESPELSPGGLCDCGVADQEVEEDLVPLLPPSDPLDPISEILTVVVNHSLLSSITQETKILCQSEPPVVVGPSVFESVERGETLCGAAITHIDVDANVDFESKVEDTKEVSVPATQHESKEVVITTSVEEHAEDSKRDFSVCGEASLSVFDFDSSPTSVFHSFSPSEGRQPTAPQEELSPSDEQQTEDSTVLCTVPLIEAQFNTHSSLTLQSSTAEDNSPLPIASDLAADSTLQTPESVKERSLKRQVRGLAVLTALLLLYLFLSLSPLASFGPLRGKFDSLREGVTDAVQQVQPQMDYVTTTADVQSGSIELEPVVEESVEVVSVEKWISPAATLTEETVRIINPVGVPQLEVKFYVPPRRQRNEGLQWWVGDTVEWGEVEVGRVQQCSWDEQNLLKKGLERASGEPRRWKQKVGKWAGNVKKFFTFRRHKNKGFK